jgi:protein TonB
MPKNNSRLWCAVAAAGALFSITFGIAASAKTQIDRGIEMPAPPVVRAGPPLPPPPPKSLRSVITQPDWVRRPTVAEMKSHFPELALRLGTAGRVLLHCKVKADGTLEQCKVVSQMPDGLQFGRAALEMVPFFKMREETRDGEPVGGKAITIPVVFLLPYQ